MDEQILPLTDDNNFIDSFASKIKKLKLETPAVLFLEMHRPVSSLLHNSAILLKPLLTPLLGQKRYWNIQELLSDREKIEQLIRKIEEP